MSFARKVRDPIHTFIDLTSYESDIIASPVFQRLRRIRQLAFAYLVYPGALHTRFEHSLGVKHIANQMATKLLDNSEREELDIISYAALLHDIGHGPFSHVSEDALEICCDKSSIPLPAPNIKVHELITTKIIKFDSVISRALSLNVIDKICNLLTIGYGPPLWKSIVSGPLDADKQDYLLRDSYFCGVKYGVFDLHQLHRAFSKIEDQTDTGPVLGITTDGINATEQFFLAKRFFLTQVLNHRVRRIADQMLLRAILTGLADEKVEELAKIYEYEDGDDYIRNYLKWDDFKFFSFLTDDKMKGKLCYDLTRRLAERKLFKRIYQKRLDQLEPITRDLLIDLNKPQQKELRGKIESAVKDIVEKKIRDTPKLKGKITLCCDDCRYWVAHVYKIDSIRIMAKNDEIEDTPVRCDDGNIRSFSSESKLFNGFDPSAGLENYISIYSPIDYETSSDRALLTKSVGQPITDIINKICGEKGGIDGNT